MFEQHSYNAALRLRLAELLRRHGWSQRELGRRAQVDQSTLSSFLARENGMRPATVAKVADALGMSPWILTARVRCRHCLDIAPVGYSCNRCGMCAPLPPSQAARQVPGKAAAPAVRRAAPRPAAAPPKPPKAPRPVAAARQSQAAVLLPRDDDRARLAKLERYLSAAGVLLLEEEEASRG